MITRNTAKYVQNDKFNALIEIRPLEYNIIQYTIHIQYTIQVYQYYIYQYYFLRVELKIGIVS